MIDREELQEYYKEEIKIEPNVTIYKELKRKLYGISFIVTIKGYDGYFGVYEVDDEDFFSSIQVTAISRLNNEFPDKPNIPKIIMFDRLYALNYNTTTEENESVMAIKMTPFDLLIYTTTL